jgi:non-ribosomal peptide synthetase component F
VNRPATAVTIHAMVSDQARRRPDAVAIVSGDVRVTYRALDAWSDRIARRLVDSGVAPGESVAVAVSRSPDYPAAVLGGLRAARPRLSGGTPGVRPDRFRSDRGPVR